MRAGAEKSWGKAKPLRSCWSVMHQRSKRKIRSKRQLWEGEKTQDRGSWRTLVVGGDADRQKEVELRVTETCSWHSSQGLAAEVLWGTKMTSQFQFTCNMMLTFIILETELMHCQEKSEWQERESKHVFSINEPSLTQRKQWNQK